VLLTQRMLRGAVDFTLSEHGGQVGFSFSNDLEQSWANSAGREPHGTSLQSPVGPIEQKTEFIKQ